MTHVENAYKSRSDTIFVLLSGTRFNRMLATNNGQNGFVTPQLGDLGREQKACFRDRLFFTILLQTVHGTHSTASLANVKERKLLTQNEKHASETFSGVFRIIKPWK